MDETRVRTGDEQPPRGDAVPEWEVFRREAVADPLQHVGRVTAPTPAVAHEQATQLFGGDARDLWLCAASDVHRFSTYSLAEGGAKS